MKEMKYMDISVNGRIQSRLIDKQDGDGNPIPVLRDNEVLMQSFKDKSYSIEYAKETALFNFEMFKLDLLDVYKKHGVYLSSSRGGQLELLSDRILAPNVFLLTIIDDIRNLVDTSAQRT